MSHNEHASARKVLIDNGPVLLDYADGIALSLIHI